MPIDTLKAAKRLQEDGTFSVDQAERIAEIFAGAHDNTATKDDVDVVRADVEDVRSEIKEMEGRLRYQMNEMETRLRSDLRGDLADLRADMYKAIGGSIIAVGAIVALIEALLG